MVKFKVGDKVKITSGEKRGSIGIITLLKSSWAMFQNWSRERTKKSLKFNRLSLRKFHVSNLRHLDQNNQVSKICRGIWNGKNFRFYKNTLRIVRGDALAIVESKRRKLLSARTKNV